MKDKKIFIDTNILVYAHDSDAGKKHNCAKSKILELWNGSTRPATSIQVLQELYVTLLKHDIPSKTAQEIVQSYLQWDIIENDATLLLEGMRIKDRFKTSFWDALVVAAAIRAEAQILLTEDLNPNQSYEGVIAQNPFSAI